MYDVAIVGGGPAGASAAIYTARAGLQTVMLDADQSVTRRALINNHLGYPEGITGPEMIQQGKEQAARAGAEIVTTKVAELKPQDGGFVLQAENGSSYEAKQVILALGLNVELATKAGIATKPGTEPRVKEIVDVDSQGRTSLPGVWATGAGAGMSIHTIITAGDGARVAINLISEHKGQRHVDHEAIPATPAPAPAS